MFATRHPNSCIECIVICAFLALDLNRSIQTNKHKHGQWASSLILELQVRSLVMTACESHVGGVSMKLPIDCVWSTIQNRQMYVIFVGHISDRLSVMVSVVEHCYTPKLIPPTLFRWQRTEKWVGNNFFWISRQKKQVENNRALFSTCFLASVSVIEEQIYSLVKKQITAWITLEYIIKLN